MLHRVRGRMPSIGIGILFLLVLALFFGGVSDTKGAFISSEVAFTDVAPSGLAIVPASCPSDPHYSGECSSGGGSACLNGLDISQYPTCTCPSGYVVYANACYPITWCTNGLDQSYYPSCTCPAGQTQSGSTCVTGGGSCPNGLDMSQYPSCTCPSGYIVYANACYPITWCTNGLAQSYFPSCTCPAGQIQSGSECISNISCPNGLSMSLYPSCECPAGQTQSGNLCVGFGQCTAQYFCSGNDLYYRSATCSESFSQACAWGCSNGACAQDNVPPPPASGTISANPALIRSDRTSIISWSASNVRANSCTVEENNPDIVNAWSGNSGSRTTSPINQQTTYTLRCTGLDGAPFSDSVKVNVIPNFEEQ